jgi:hypothetical protein
MSQQRITRQDKYPSTREYSVTVQVTDTPHNDFDFPLRERSEKYLSQSGEVGRKLIEELAKVDGIVKVVFLDRYTIRVDIGSAHRWDEDGIEEQIKQILLEAFDDPDEVEFSWEAQMIILSQEDLDAANDDLPDFYADLADED